MGYEDVFGCVAVGEFQGGMVCFGGGGREGFDVDFGWGRGEVWIEDGGEGAWRSGGSGVLEAFCGDVGFVGGHSLGGDEEIEVGALKVGSVQWDEGYVGAGGVVGLYVVGGGVG